MTRSSGSDGPDPQSPKAAAGLPGRANPLDDPQFVAGLRPIPTGPPAASEQWPAADLTGQGLDGHRLVVRIDGQPGPLLLCFLQTHCDGCEEFWRGVGDPPGSDWPDPLSWAVVTRGPDSVDRSEVTRLAAGAVTRAVPVVMGERAWADYRVTGYPFFVLVDPTHGTVVGETVGFGWPDVEAMVRMATDGR
jgi:hypothetical protein